MNPWTSDEANEFVSDANQLLDSLVGAAFEPISEFVLAALVGVKDVVKLDDPESLGIALPAALPRTEASDGLLVLS